MKLKYYLRGLGIGILITAAILTIIYHTKGSLTDAQIKERAQKLGMVMATTEPDVLFNASDDTEGASGESMDETDNQDGTTDGETEPFSGEQKTEPATDEPETEPATDEPETEPVTKEPEPTEPITAEPEPVVNSVTLTIRRGMSSESVAAELARLGVVANQSELNSYLENNGYSERIQTGDFIITSDMTYEQIARIITRS